MAALMVGLYDAQQTGVGRDLDVSLLDTAVSPLSYFAVWALNRDWVPERTAESADQTIVPAQNFQTRDGWIVVFCNKERFWHALVDALGAPELGYDPRFATMSLRLANRDALLPLLKARFATRATAGRTARSGSPSGAREWASTPTPSSGSSGTGAAPSSGLTGDGAIG